MAIPPGPPDDDEEVCDTCQGAKVITDTSGDTDIAPVIECPACGGTGVK